MSVISSVHPFEVLHEVVVCGCMPGTKAHQFDLTRERLPRMAMDQAEIGDHDLCCEPGAGTDGRAEFTPKERTT